MTPDFRTPTQPLTVRKASPSAFPTTGTKLETANLTARDAAESAEEVTMLCTVSTPLNSVMAKPSTHFTTLENNSQRLPSFKTGHTEATSESARKQPMSGTSSCCETRDTALPANVVIVS